MKRIPVIDTKPFEVYLDLDGVFADLEKKIVEIAKRPREEIAKKEFWKIVYSVPDFFYILDLMPEAEHLWAYAKQYDSVRFLTGAPNSKTAQEHKRLWVKERFGSEYETIVLPRKEKKLHSGPNKLLIDDHPENIAEWIAMGGHGILHDGDVWRTIKLAEEIRQAYGEFLGTRSTKTA